MLIQSKLKRSYWMGSVLGFVPELLIAGVVTAAADEGWVLFVAVFFGLYAVYFAIWLKKTIWVWTLFLLLGKKQMTRGFLSHLREHKYPEPGDLLIDSDEYFKGVMQRKDVADETRIDAATVAGFLEFPRVMAQAQNTLRFHIAIENAIQAYKADFSPRAAQHMD